MSARLWIVRHGNTFEADEPPRRIGARTDLPLTETGRSQARALRDRFAEAGIRFDRVLAAPLLRTRETAAIVAGDIEQHSAEWLVEIDHGPDENALEADVLARVGAPALSAWDAFGIAPPGWIVDPERRRADWRAAYAQARGDMLLATSSGAARFAALALPRRPDLPLKLRTGAWGRIDVDGERASLIEWDRRP